MQEKDQFSRMVWFNPFEHLTESRMLTEEEWENLKSDYLDKGDLNYLAKGGLVRFGASRVWDAQWRELRRAYLTPPKSNEEWSSTAISDSDG